MKILLTNWQWCGDYDAKRWLSRLEKYGVDYSRLIELPTEHGLNHTNRHLIFVFKEPNTIADITVIGYGNCYRLDDSTAGYFYTEIMKHVHEEQFFSATEIPNTDYTQGVSEAVFGFDEDRPLWKRKEALEKFLIENFSTFILK